MPLSRNKDSFGGRVADLRRARGLTQDAIAGRVSTYYSDASSYRRIESGKRQPERDAAVAILIKGLGLTDPKEINAILSLAGYDGLSEADIQRTKSEQMVTVPVDPSIPAKIEPEAFWDRVGIWRNVRALQWVSLGGSLALSVMVCSVGGGQAWFWMVSGIIYSALYPVSLLLESSYENHHPRIIAAGIFAFCFALLTSTGALALDFISVQAGMDYGLALSLPIIVAAAGLQWVLVRTALSRSSIVGARFQFHTAQAAHLKNTLYFLVIVLLFWVPPAHAVMWLRRYADSGHRDDVRMQLSHWLIVNEAVLSPGPGILAAMFVALLLLSIPMRSQLLDNLKSDPHTNSFTNWFYVRAFLYFCLCLLCMTWYAMSVASLRA